MEPIGRYDGQVELVVLLAEEMGEAQQIVGKALRHGLRSKQRFEGGEYGQSNAELLTAEVGDILAAIEMLMASRVLPRQQVHAHALDKVVRVRQWLHSIEGKNAASVVEIGEARVMFDLSEELRKAQSDHRRYNSAHEGYAVLAEEVAELWEEVRKKPGERDAAAMRKEALQVATVAIRFILDLVPAERAVPIEAAKP